MLRAISKAGSWLWLREADSELMFSETPHCEFRVQVGHLLPLPQNLMEGVGWEIHSFGKLSP